MNKQIGTQPGQLTNSHSLLPSGILPDSVLDTFEFAVLR